MFVCFQGNYKLQTEKQCILNGFSGQKNPRTRDRTLSSNGVAFSFGKWQCQVGGEGEGELKNKPEGEIIFCEGNSKLFVSRCFFLQLSRSICVQLTFTSCSIFVDLTLLRDTKRYRIICIFTFVR